MRKQLHDKVTVIKSRKQVENDFYEKKESKTKQKP